MARNPKFPKDTMAAGRQIMTCCVEDIQYCWLAAQFGSAPEIQERSWAMLTGKIKVQKHKLYHSKGPVLFVSEAQKCAPPEKQVATFY